MRPRSSLPKLAFAAWVAPSVFALAMVENPTPPSLAELSAQNRKLQEQVDRQQRLLDDLGARLSELQQSRTLTDKRLHELDGQVERAGGPTPTRDRDHEVRISGEAGLAFFSTGQAGQFPNSEFRIDDAKLFVEAGDPARRVFLHRTRPVCAGEQQRQSSVRRAVCGF